LSIFYPKAKGVEKNWKYDYKAVILEKEYQEKYLMGKIYKEDAKILIVDDDFVFRGQIRNILTKNKFKKIHEAIDGLDALKKCETLNPSIVILDIIMPKLSGLNCMGLLYNCNPNVKILISSQLDDPSIQDQARRKGAIDWIKKPVDEELLLEKINSLFSKEKKPPQEIIKDLMAQGEKFSENMGIKIDSSKQLQMVNLYGMINDSIIADLKEVIELLQSHGFINCIINLNGISGFNAGLNELKNIYEMVKTKNGRFMITVLKKEITDELIALGMGDITVKTEVQAIKNI